MVRKVSILAAIVVMFSFCSYARAAQISVSWDGGGDGRSWADANNWNPNIVPDNDGNTFAVTIDSNYAGVDKIDVGLQQDRTIDQLDCYGKVELPTWTSGWVELTIYNGLTNHGELEIGEINIRGNITNTTGATLGLYEDKFIRDGNVYNQAGAMILVDDEVDVEDGGLENAGVIEIIPSGVIYVNEYLHNVGQILVHGGECGCSEGILDNDSNGVIKGFGNLMARQKLGNKGEIYAYGGSLTVGILEGPLLNSGLLCNYPLASLQIKPSVYTNPAADVNNNGTIEVNAGGGVAFDCNLVNEPNGAIELLGGTLAAQTITQSAGATFEGFGGITGNVIIEPNSVSEPNSIIRLTGPTNIVGDVNIPAGATLEISDGQTLITGHTTCDGTIHLIGGTVIFQGGCDCDDCNIINEAGIDRNHFDINADGIENFEDFADFANTWLWKASWY